MGGKGNSMGGKHEGGMQEGGHGKDKQEEDWDYEGHAMGDKEEGGHQAIAYPGQHQPPKKNQTFKYNFQEVFQQFEGLDLTAEQRYHALSKREDFDDILKAVKMRVASEWKRSHEKTGHMAEKHTPFDAYKKAFKDDLMFYQCPTTDVEEVENPRHGMEEMQKLRKWMQRVREHRQQIEEPYYPVMPVEPVGGNGGKRQEGEKGP